MIPGHGRLCDEADVVEYRDMVTIIRDRISGLIKKGMTLEQVKAAKPTLDYDGRYGADDRPVDDRDVHRGGVPRSRARSNSGQFTIYNSQSQRGRNASFAHL